ncbi:hypothetical protein ACQ10I_14480, partial [Enterococcus faecalis]
VGITIYGGNGTDTINLATGADIVWLDVGTTTITLGGSANQVHGGGGTATINASIANAGALIQGAATGSTTLHLTNAGSATLNAADTNLTVVAQAGSAITLSKQAGVTADGSAGAITLTALATGQTLIGGKGDDVYLVNDTHAVVIEQAGEGNDRIVSTVSYTLSDNVEILQLAGSA